MAFFRYCANNKDAANKAIIARRGKKANNRKQQATNNNELTERRFLQYTIAVVICVAIAFLIMHK